MENENENTSVNLYNIINKYYKNKLLILFTVSLFVIIATMYYYTKPTTYRASINVGEVANFEFNMDLELSRYFKSKDNINSKLFLNNFLTKIKSFSIYEKLAFELKAELNKGKFDSVSKLNNYDLAKYIYDRVDFKESAENFTGISYQISYTDNKLKLDEVKNIFYKLISLISKEGTLDLRKNLNKNISDLEYQIIKMKKNHEFNLNKKEIDLRLQIDQLIIKLNYDNSTKIRNLKEQIEVAKNLGFTDSQLGVVDRASDLVQNALVGKLPKDQVLNLPLYFFGSKILEEELRYLQLNTININTLGNYGGQKLLAELETIKYQYSDIFIDNLSATVINKNELSLLEKTLDNNILLEHNLLEFNLEKIKVIKINNVSLVKLILSCIILSLLLCTALILYNEEHKTRISKLLTNK